MADYRRSESAFRAINFHRGSKPLFFRGVQSIDVQSQRSKHRHRESAFKASQSQCSEHKHSELASRA